MGLFCRMTLHRVVHVGSCLPYLKAANQCTTFDGLSTVVPNIKLCSIGTTADGHLGVYHMPLEGGGEPWWVADLYLCALVACASTRYTLVRTSSSASIFIDFL